MIPLMAALGCTVHFQNVRIDSGSSRNGPEEPSICVNQHNTQNIVAGSNIRNTYSSQDGGVTWSKQIPTSDYGVFGDPCIVSDPRNGNVYFLHLSDVEGHGWMGDSLLDRIVCQRSEDGGVSWSRGSYMGARHPKDQDKEWAIVNPFNGEIYVTWTQFDLYNSSNPKDSSVILFSKSSDFGESWTEPIRINKIAGDCLDGDNTVEGAVPAVGPSGEIYVSWSLAEKIYFDRSYDGGKTWLDKDRVVADQPGGWAMEIPGINRCNGMPVTLCDVSGSKHDGTIYVNWSDTRNGINNADIWLAKSHDHGDTWSEPIRVNKDKGERHQFFTWMDIDQTNGHLYTVYYDRSNTEGNETDVVLAYSKNGARSFSQISLTDSSFTPTENVFFGDYNNISAHDNVIRPIWTRLENDTLSIWTALVDGKKLR